ncbi:CHAT domain-containing protein [Gracilimonas mengyeensis]|uniref:CHAT domain-containing protein n=1 Tax=Gracilimonas mengyeensis TaxID=1302730 RepID=A0A521DQ63_9BACT|nr:CHAT domain-containing protein [Gracilimonas mengyeensis]SMO73843.1 CHAT domain-containing protein [Gracilimonas mengyeensis]
MLYIIIVIFSFSSFSSVDKDSTNLDNEIKKQLNGFIENVERNDLSILNFWAINEIAQTNCQALRIVKSSIDDHTSFDDYKSKLSCNNDKNTFDSLTIKHFWPKSHQQLYYDIIDNKTDITERELGFLEAPYLHLKLLMNRNHSNYYTEEYLLKALETWDNYIENNKTKKDLEYYLIVSEATWVAFMLDEYNLVNKYSQDIINSDILPISNFLYRVYSAIDYSYFFLDRYDKSLDIQRNYSLPLAEYIGDKDEIKQIKKRQGVYLYSLGKYEESKNIYEDIYRNNGQSDFYIFTNLGINYYRLGYSNKYISFQLKALEHDAANYKNLLNVYRNLFLYYTNAKDIASALTYIEKAKNLALENADTTELALIDSYLGTFYWSTYKDQEKAIQHLESAEEILNVDNNYSKYIQLLVQKGLIYIKTDSLEKAELVFDKVVKLSLSKSDTQKYLQGIINKALINLQQNEIEQASEKLNEIELYSLDILDFPTLTTYFRIKSEYLLKENNYRGAISTLAPVIQQIISLSKNNTDSQEGYWSVEEEYLDAFELMVDLYLESGNPEQALIVLDELKTINDASLYNSPLVKAAKLTEQELAKEKRLNNQLQNLRKKYLNAPESNRFAIKTEIERVSAEREEILAKINVAAEESLPPLWKIQRAIEEDELALHFTELGEHFYVTMITSDDVKVRKHDYPFSLQQRFSSIGDEIASGKTNLQHLYDLYQKLDLDEVPASISKISIIPDQFIYRIPLEILPTHKPDSDYSFGSTKYLIEDYHISYFNSLAELDANRRIFDINTKQDFTAFAISDFSEFESADLPSLPYATEETKDIYGALNSLKSKKIHIGDAATKETFKEEISSSRIVHVATHSEISEQDPLFSTIYLKGRDNADSLESEQALYAYELFDTPLNSEFIMLNSCSSGSGNYMQGTGILGISRALRYAGVKGMALNLWSVNDKVAAQISTDFYQYLDEGLPKHEAMRNAKLNQLKSANANPHFWGAYMMIGNPAPITSRNNHPMFLYSLLAATILLSGYISYKRERRGKSWF